MDHDRVRGGLGDWRAAWPYLMPMTAVPKRTGAVARLCALASALIGTAEFLSRDTARFVTVALVVETLLGFLTSREA